VDVYNNPITTEIQFVVVGDESIVDTCIKYPNPFVNYTEFCLHIIGLLSHEQIQVMTITGKVVWTKNQIISTEGFYQKRSLGTVKDDFGNKIERSVYSTNRQIYLTNKEQKSLKNL
jgi:hypothetical protein